MIPSLQASLFKPILADVDIGQIVVFVVVAIVAFVQWVINLIKEKAEAAERSRRAPTPAEEEARRRAWAEQTRTPPPSPPPHANTPTAGGMLEDLLGEFRKALDQSQQTKPPALPPVAPKVKAAVPPLPLAPRVPPVESLPVLPPLQSIRAGRKKLHPLTQLLRTPGGYQQAFVLREVLGPPRGLEEYQGPD